MPTLSRWIVAFGLLLIACDVTDLFADDPIGLGVRTHVPGWAGGTLMIAAGLLTTAGRRSLRRAGIAVSIFLPLGLAGIFAWHAARLWQQRADNPSISMLVALEYSGLAVASIALVALVARLRPREGIASRGYAVTLPSSPRTTLSSPQIEQVAKPRRSEAG